MPSRRKRKRERRLAAEATAGIPKTAGGWGNGLPASPADMLLVRQAIREHWPTPDHVQDAIVFDLFAAMNATRPRCSVAAVKVLLAMEAHNAAMNQ